MNRKNFNSNKVNSLVRNYKNILYKKIYCKIVV